MTGNTNWNLSVPEAIALQQQLRLLVRLSNRLQLEDIKTIAGVDASYTDESRAAVVLLSFPDLAVLEQAEATRSTSFPYVPGLLSFREAPVVLEALAKLHVAPDLIMVDGQGYAHPRRFGLACHLGVSLDKPTIGCAKSRLIGAYTEPGPNLGDRSPLHDRGETIGMVLRSKPKTTPLYISAGHLIDLETAVTVTLSCLRGYRMPEPTRLADKLSKAAGTAG